MFYILESRSIYSLHTAVQAACEANRNAGKENFKVQVLQKYFRFLFMRYSVLILVRKLNFWPLMLFALK